MKRGFVIMIVILITLAGCAGTKNKSIQGQWKSSTGEEIYISETDIFDSGFVMPYRINSDKELMITNANGVEQAAEYSITGTTLTLKIGNKGMVYSRLIKNSETGK